MTLLIGRGILPQALLDLPYSRLVLLTDSHVERLHGRELERALQRQGLNVSLISFTSGEPSKTRETKQKMEDLLLEMGASRDTCLVGLGGGVVTDLAGFIASTYCRGIPLILAPTSLMAMVDAAIGGKNGVNTLHGKNLIGTYYPPHKVIIDIQFLTTLSLEELKMGFVEMIKHGLIADAPFLHFLESNAKALLELDGDLLEKTISRSCQIKSAIVQEDPLEKSKRRILNFGHTIGHALENASDYTLPHGKAVAIGMVVESYLASQPDLAEKIQHLLTLFHIDFRWPRKLTLDRVLRALLYDKKAIKHIPRFVILEEIGKPFSYEGQFCTPIEENHLKTVLQQMCSDVLCLH